MAEDACTQKVLAAAEAENAAIELDRAGHVQDAITMYEECELQLAAAIALALPAHADDHPKLVHHRKEILDRTEHLKSLKGGAPTIPLEQQIKAVQLGMKATTAATDGANKAGGAKTLAACAAMGAAGGFLVLGAIPLMPGTVAAVGGAAAAGYCATRQDKIGDVARTAGGIAVGGVEKAVELNREHNITGKLADTTTKAVGCAKEVDSKYGISSKVMAGVSAAAGKAKEIEDKHNVTGKVAGGIAAGLGKVGSLLDKRSSTSGASGGYAAGASGTSGTSDPKV